MTGELHSGTMTLEEAVEGRMEHATSPGGSILQEAISGVGTGIRAASISRDIPRQLYPVQRTRSEHGVIDGLEDRVRSMEKDELNYIYLPVSRNDGGTTLWNYDAGGNGRGKDGTCNLAGRLNSTRGGFESRNWYQSCIHLKGHSETIIPCPEDWG